MPVKKKPVSSKQSTVNSKKEETKVERPSFVSSKKDVIVPVLVGAIIVAAFAVGFLFGKLTVYEKLGATGDTKVAKTTETTPTQPTATVTLDQVKGLFTDKKNIVFGDANKKVLFVEFSDPSCPYCHIAAGMNASLNKEAGDRFLMVKDGGKYVAPVPEMKKLVDAGKAGYVWMYSPGHGNGELATQIFYCAKDQNKFWEAHDLLMSAKGYDLLNNTVKNDANNIGLVADLLKPVMDINKLTACVQSGTYAGRVQSDEALSRTFGVSGTPSFFINTKNFSGAYSYVDMQSNVDAALK